MSKLPFLLGGLVAASGALFVAAGGSLPTQLAAVTTSQQNCAAITQYLALGSTDARTKGEVSMLQKVLAADTKIYPEARVTGYFGEATARALKRWQAAQGIEQTGATGPKTRAALACKPAPATDPAQTPATPAPTTTAPAASTAPTCTLTTDREEYAFGNKLYIYWSTTNADYVSFVQPRSSDLYVPVAGSYGPKGQLELTINVSGTPKITLVAYNKTASTTCERTIRVGAS